MEPTPILLFRREIGLFSNKCFQGSQVETTLKKSIICNEGFTQLSETTMELQGTTVGPYGNRNPVYDMQFSLNETQHKLLSIGDEEGFVTIVNKNSTLVSRNQFHRHPVMSIKWSPFQSNLLASGSGDSSIGILQLAQDGKIVLLNELNAHTKTVKAVAFNSHSPVLASGGRDGCIYLWDLRCDNLQPINLISNAHGVSKHGTAKTSNQIADLTFQDEHNLISCGTTDGQIKFWDIRKTYRCLTKKFSYKSFNYPSSNNSNCKGFSSMTLSQDNVLYASTVSHEIFRYDLDSGNNSEPVFIYVTPEKLSYYIKIDVSRDGRFLVSGSDSEDVYIFDTLNKSSQPFHTIHNRFDTIVSVARFHPDNCFKVAFGTDDSCVKFWECNVLDKKTEPELHPTFSTISLKSSLPLHYPKYSKSTQNEQELSMNMESLIRDLPNYIVDGQLAHVHSPYKIIRRRTNWFDNAKNLLRPQQQRNTIIVKPKTIKIKKRTLNFTKEDACVTKKIKMKSPHVLSATTPRRTRNSKSKKSELNNSFILDYFRADSQA